jgi:glycerate-2-kinase
MEELYEQKKLLACGAEFKEMIRYENCFRRSGGRLLKYVHPRTYSHCSSDIIGDPQDMIASGPRTRILNQ